MKKTLCLVLFLLAVQLLHVRAHDIHQDGTAVRRWHVNGLHHRSLKASFFIMRSDTVYLESHHGDIIRVPLKDLSAADQTFVREKQERVNAINRSYRTVQKATPSGRASNQVADSSFPAGIFSFCMAAVLAAVLLVRLF
ncbi:MAG: y domain 1, partial [Bacteroidota bacterium]